MREAEERSIFEGLIEAEHRERFPNAHLDKRWRRTVWYCNRKKQYKSRTVTKEIQWKRPVGWRPETIDEVEEREKFKRLKI